MPKSDENNDQTIICLNCGTECHDKFCPHCGQSTSIPPKLKMKNFGRGVVMSFGRLTPGFFTTAKGLLFRPWDVIRDHIHGKHIRYSPPITMVIQIYLYAAILYSLIDGIFGTEIVTNYDFDANTFGYSGSNQILKLVNSSVIFETLLWGIPICFCIYLGFYRNGAKRYNFAEYLAAFFYMFAAVSIYDFIFNIAFVIPGLNFDVTYFTWFICGIFSIIVLIKAFPQKKIWKYPLLFLWTFIIIIAVINAIILCVYKLTGYNLVA